MMLYHIIKRIQCDGYYKDPDDLQYVSKYLVLTNESASENSSILLDYMILAEIKLKKRVLLIFHIYKS